MSAKAFNSYLFAAMAVLSATFVLWLLRETLTQANFSLVYVLVVIISAMHGGTGSSLFAALLSLLCFNFFLVRPYYTFFVADPRDFVDLVIFILTAIFTGQLASRARQQTEDARQRAYEQDILSKLTSSFNQITDTEGVYTALKRVLHDDLAVQHSQVLPIKSEGVSGTNILYLLLRAGDSIYGTLCASFEKPPTAAQSRLIVACAVQASMALQRIELAERAHQSRSFEEADRLKTALLHAVSHDLRTPITIIKTSASNLLNLHSTLDESERVEMLQAIDNEADQLNKMIGNLLDLSRLKAGSLQLNSDWNDLEEVAGDVAARVWQLTHQERVRIIFPADFPLVYVDYGLILQVLSNLVENSLRYEPAEKQVEIRGTAKINEVQIAVVNHGPSIPQEERDHIMEPFYHGEGGNIGLGLAIAKGIVEAHQGRLWVEDTPAGGVTFILFLPLQSVSKEVNDIHENSRG
jgi:two-component system sensor histidine kinase KdpD